MHEFKQSLAPIGRAAKRLPLGNGGESRNPGKRVKLHDLTGHEVPGTV